MAITLFQRTRFRGDSARITRDEDDLGDVPLGRNPSSMQMTNANDAVLLFKKRDWRGGVMFRRGAQNIANLGRRADGGRATFRNGIASARRTPFFINLNVTVVTQSDGTIPGTDPDFATISTRINNMVALINQFYGRENALLTANVAHLNQRVHDNKFNLSMAEAARFPAQWKNRREIDIIIVNSFNNGSFGLAKLPWFGKVCVVSMRRSGPNSAQLGTNILAKILAHEIGHFLGSPHVDNGTNVMRQGSFDIATRTATVAQIQEWHTKLSRNLTRRRNRREA